jgi:hypothetical protein
VVEVVVTQTLTVDLVVQVVVQPIPLVFLDLEVLEQQIKDLKVQMPKTQETLELVAVELVVKVE